MQIQVISCSKPEWKEKGPKSKWQEVTLTYASAGKTTAKKFLSFNAIFNKVKEMEEGESYDVTMQKNDAGYWDWTEVVKMAAGATTVSQEAPRQMSRPSTYETAEERAAKQVYIVRQSSIANALEYSKSVKALKTVEEVLDVAKKFEEYVFFEDVMDGIINMENDIPV